MNILTTLSRKSLQGIVLLLGFLSLGVLSPVLAQSLMPSYQLQFDLVERPQDLYGTQIRWTEIAIGVIAVAALIVMVFMVIQLVRIRRKHEVLRFFSRKPLVGAMLVLVILMVVEVVLSLHVEALFKLEHPTLYQTCLSAPASAGCSDCLAHGNDGSNLCSKCEHMYSDLAAGGTVSQYTNSCK